MKEALTIGKLAKASDVNVETIRFYERKGILKQPKKQGTFRYYPEDYIAKVQFIKRSQELGFTLKEARDLLNLRIKSQAKCTDVLSKTEDKIAEINQKIKDLKNMKKSLEGLANCCEDTSLTISECPILDFFMAKRDIE